MNNPQPTQETCPLSGKDGVVRRQITGRDLFQLYGSYFGQPIDIEHFDIADSQIITEFYSPDSGLIWYSPRILGDGNYYKHLNEVYPWYYNPASWDKSKCLEDAINLNPDWVVEIGSGDGWLLSKLQKQGIDCFGVEINDDAANHCRAKGLAVFKPQDDFQIPAGNGILCLLQTIEHLEDPLNTVRQYLDKFRPKHLIISGPCFKSLLGHTEDPLAWPPHHATSWSEKSMRYLGKKLGASFHSVEYSKLSFQQFRECVRRQRARQLFEAPHIPSAPFDHLLYWVGKVTRKHWATRAHSIYVRFDY